MLSSIVTALLLVIIVPSMFNAQYYPPNRPPYPGGGGFPQPPPQQPGYPSNDQCNEYIVPQRWCYSDADCRSSYINTQCDTPAYNPSVRMCRCECGFRFTGRECTRIYEGGDGQCWNTWNLLCSMSPVVGFIAIALLAFIGIFVVCICLAVTCRGGGGGRRR